MSGCIVHGRARDEMPCGECAWDAVEAKVALIRDQMPRCQCACPCQYPLYSPRSRETLTCFSCRTGLHYGARSVGTKVEAAQ